MNDRDVLKRASDALRDTTEPSPAELAALRARVLSNKVTPLARRSRSKSLRWLLPLAAALVTGSALAATPGAWQGLVDAVERYLPVELLSPAREAARPARKRTTKAPAPPPLPAPVAEPAPAAEPVEAVAPVAEAPAVVAPAPREAARAPSGRAAPPARSTPPAPQPSAPAVPEEAAPEGPPASAPSAELALYRPAHELHFRARNYAAALDAWDAYLSRFPQGTLALEAEYNRALCLLRLRRYAEARDALAPFAGGARAGGYRRSEATRFLQAMEKVP